MRNRMNRHLALLAAEFALAACAVTAGGQGAAMKRQPYTAEYRITLVRTLANGATITHVTKSVKAMDSEGRLMQASTPIGTDGTPKPDSTFLRISDPVAGTSGSWMGWRKTGSITKFPPRDEQRGCWADANRSESINYEPSAQPPPGQPPYLKPVNEDLGTETIMGLEAHGRRTILTIPTGGVGNDRPLLRTSEEWAAKNPPITLRYSFNDPLMGKETMELVSLSLNAPDPALFQPPANYKTVTVALHQVPCPPSAR